MVVFITITGSVGRAEPMADSVEPPLVDGGVTGLKFTEASLPIYKTFQGLPVHLLFLLKQNFCSFSG